AGWILHPPVFSFLALAGLGGLLYYPAQIDLAGFVLVYLARQMGGSAALRVSLPVAAAALAVVVAPDPAGALRGGAPWGAGRGRASGTPEPGRDPPDRRSAQDRRCGSRVGTYAHRQRHRRPRHPVRVGRAARAAARRR